MSTILIACRAVFIVLLALPLAAGPAGGAIEMSTWRERGFREPIPIGTDAGVQEEAISQHETTCTSTRGGDECGHCPDVRDCEPPQRQPPSGNDQRR